MLRWRIWGVVTVGLVLVAALVGCTTQATDTPEPAPSDAVLSAARQALSTELGIATDEIELVAAQNTEWPNACLGLREEDEVCAQVITPGWRIVLEAEGEEYVYRTDDTGQIVRRDEGATP